MIEKKICSKLLLLFSMFFASFVLSFLLFPVSSKAYVAPDNVNYAYYQNMSGGWEYFSDLPYCYIRNSSNNNATSYPMLTIVDILGVKYIAGIHSVSNSNNVTFIPYDTVNHNFTSFNSDLVKIYYNGGTRTGSYNMTCLTGNIDSNLFFQDYDSALAYLIHESAEVDWDNPFYNANIPVPNVSIEYREINPTSVDVPLNVSIQDYSDCSIEVMATYSVPDEVMVNYAARQQSYTYTSVHDIWVYNDVLISAQSGQRGEDYTVDQFHTLLTNEWSSNIPDLEDISVFFDSDSYPALVKNNAITRYDNLRKVQTLYGNQTTLYFRYCYVDDDFNFVVGPWRIWYSYDPSTFYDYAPDYYSPYIPAKGTQGVSSNTQTLSPGEVDVIEPTGLEQTGTNINLTVNQNVPNYPDYPTIASYNKDNLLVDTIKSMQSFTLFFGDFGLFLTVAFGFIPEWIWGIIGVGFSLSIIVMFLKIL